MRNAPYLTDGYHDDLTRQINATVPGMAHFAGTGPANTQCLTCKFWSKFRKRACGKFFDLTGKHGPQINGNPQSCRHYEPRQATRSS